MSFARRAGHNSALGARTHLRTGEDFMAEIRASPVSASPAQRAEGRRRQRFTADGVGMRRLLAQPAPRILTIAHNRLTETFESFIYYLLHPSKEGLANGQAGGCGRSLVMDVPVTPNFRPRIPFPDQRRLANRPSVGRRREEDRHSRIRL